MIALFGAVYLVVAFVVLLRVFNVVHHSTAVIATAKGALTDLRRPDLDDEGKERALQSHAKQLFAGFFLITAGAAAALVIPILPIWLLEQADVLRLADVIAMTLSWELVATATIVGAAVFMVKRKH